MFRTVAGHAKSLGSFPNKPAISRMRRGVGNSFIIRHEVGLSGRVWVFQAGQDGIDQILEVEHAALIGQSAERQRDPAFHQPDQPPKIGFHPRPVNQRRPEDNIFQAGPAGFLRTCSASALLTA